MATGGLLALALAEPVLAGAIALILVCVAIVLLIQARRAMKALLRLPDKWLGPRQPDR